MLKDFIDNFKKDKSFAMAIIILAIILISVLITLFFNIDPNEIHLDKKLLEPSIIHIFGTDELGRDYFARALYGGRISLSVGILSMVISIFLGSFIGILSGYIGGTFDDVFMRIVDILLSIPSFLVLIVLNSFLQPNVLTIIVIIGCLSWMDVSRIVRGETIRIKKSEYCLVAKALGASSTEIVIKHIIVNIKDTILVAASLNIASAILTESALSFLGLGVQLPLASWGNMLQDAQKYIFDKLYLAIFPGLLIFLTVVSLTVVSKRFSK